MLDFNTSELDRFLEEINLMKQRGYWTKDEMKCLFSTIIPNFDHKETLKYLDSKM